MLRTSRADVLLKLPITRSWRAIRPLQRRGYSERLLPQNEEGASDEKHSASLLAYALVDRWPPPS